MVGFPPRLPLARFNLTCWPIRFHSGQRPIPILCRPISRPRVQHSLHPRLPWPRHTSLRLPQAICLGRVYGGGMGGPRLWVTHVRDGRPDEVHHLDALATSYPARADLG